MKLLICKSNWFTEDGKAITDSRSGSRIGVAVDHVVSIEEVDVQPWIRLNLVSATGPSAAYFPSTLDQFTDLIQAGHI